MDGPKHLVLQLFGGNGNFDIYMYVPTFSHQLFGGSGNFDMHGPKYLAFQLYRVVGTWICMDPTFSFSIV